MTEGELRPCPFCGYTAFLTIEAGCYVHCASCCVDGSVFDNFADERDYAPEIVALWNTRTPTAAPSDEVVEKVARAIYSEWWDWADCDGSIRSDDMKEVARAAIAALSAIEGEKK